MSSTSNPPACRQGFRQAAKHGERARFAAGQGTVRFGHIYVQNASVHMERETDVTPLTEQEKPTSPKVA